MLNAAVKNIVNDQKAIDNWWVEVFGFETLRVARKWVANEAPTAALCGEGLMNDSVYLTFRVETEEEAIELRDAILAGQPKAVVAVADNDEVAQLRAELAEMNAKMAEMMAAMNATSQTEDDADEAEAGEAEPETEAEPEKPKGTRRGGK